MIRLAHITQETDSFNPQPTTLEDFRRTRLVEGGRDVSMLEGAKGLNGFVSEYMSEARSDRFHPVISASSVSGGRIVNEALAYFRDVLVRGFAPTAADDTLFIHLHGAMSSEAVDDCEGYLLRAVRDRIGPDPRLVLLLDHHANVTREIMACADLVIGYESQPHAPSDDGRKAARILRRLVAEDIRLATAWRKIPMIAPQDRFLTGCDGPMREWFELARRFEQDSAVVAVSLFPMQPWLDVEEGGWSVVVHAVDQAVAEKCADELAEKAWSLREDFWVSERVPPAEAMRIADNEQSGLTVVSDTGDAVLGGAPGDSTVLLGAMLARPPRSAVFLPLVDAQAVQCAHRAELGSTISLTVGAAAGQAFYAPVTVTGLLRARSVSQCVSTRFGHCNTGRTALIQIGRINLVLSEFRSRAMNDPVMYTHLGLKMNDAGAVVLKTGSNFQAFTEWRKQLVRADTPGTTQSRLQDFTWRKLPRPIFPFDDIKHWR